MVITTCVRCRKLRKGVLPIYCNCGNVIGTEYRLHYLPPLPPTLPRKSSHADICRLNRCGHYSRETCLLHISKMKSKGIDVGGHVSYLDHHPKVHCPNNPPEWYIGDVGFISVSYMNIGGTETFHRTLVPNLQNVGGFVVTNPELANGDFSTLGCQYGIGLTAAQRLAESVKLLIVWGVGKELEYILPPNRPRVVSMAHCDNNNGWTCQFMRQQAPWSDHFVYINKNGLGTVPLARQADATLLSNGIDKKRTETTRTREEIRSSLGIPQDARMGVMITRLSEEKGVLEAMQAVRQTNTYLLVAGDASDWNKQYEKQCRRLQSKRVYLLPAVDTPAELLKAADYYLSTSHYEGFGLSMAEAMAAGVQVIGTPFGILHDHPECAHLLPKKPLAGDIIDAILHPRDTRAVASRLVEELFSTEAFVNRWQRFINEQLAYV